MAGPFDRTLKHLLDAFAADWVRALGPVGGVPTAGGVDPIDADLSTVGPAADKVYRLRPPAAGVLHLEPQAGWDGSLADRLLLYNVLLEHRHGGPVYTVGLLLRREADSPQLTGVLSRATPDGAEYLHFNYTLVRVWRLSADDLLAAGLGVAPLALLTDDAAGRLPEVVTRFAEKVERERPDADAGNMLLSSGFILMGLRYDKAVARSLFMGVQKMRESSTYMAILEEGEERGVVKGEQDAILTILEERFGSVPQAVSERVRAVGDAERLRAAIRQAIRVTSPDDLTP